MRGTWQGSGTWQSSGPDPGLIIVAALVLLLGGSGAAAAIASALVTLLIVAAIAVVLALAVTVFLIWRVSGNRGMVYRPNPPVVTAAPKPQVTQGTQVPAVEHHIHYEIHYHGADTRTPSGIPVIPGRVITGKEE